MNFLSIIALCLLLFNQVFLRDTSNEKNKKSQFFNYRVLYLLERRRQLWKERKCLFDYYLTENDICVSLIKINLVSKVDLCHQRYGRMMEWNVANQISEASFDSIIREIEMIENAFVKNETEFNENKLCLKFAHTGKRYLCYGKNKGMNIWKSCLRETKCYHLCYHTF